jgi:hypothetical protein
MTASHEHEFDRRLALFLDDGPTRSPERPVDGAITYALAHPRRRDPFAALRSDPMASRRATWSSRPVLVLAILGLLLSLSVAAFVGSQRQQPTVLPPLSPEPTASAEPSQSSDVLPSLSPSVAPAEAASPSPTRSAPTSVEVTDANGLTATIQIVDQSGLLTNATGFPAEPDRFQNAEIEAIQLPADEGAGERAIILMWTDLSCPGPHKLTIDATARHFVLEPQSCVADSIGVDHQLVLSFSEPVPAKEIQAEIVR